MSPVFILKRQENNSLFLQIFLGGCIKFLNSDSISLVLVKIVSLKLFFSLWNQHSFASVSMIHAGGFICLKGQVRRLWGDYSSNWISVFRNASLTPSGKHVALTSSFLVRTVRRALGTSFRRGVPDLSAIQGYTKLDGTNLASLFP